MAGRGPKINVTISGDETDLKRAFRSSGDAVNSFGGTFKRVLSTRIVTGFLDGIADVGRALFDFGKEGVDKLDTLGDSLALIDANFKGLGKTVEALDLSDLGFSDLESAKAAEGISSIARSLGLAKDEAFKMTPALTTAAAAYGSLTGADAQAAGDLFGKALGGSQKAAKELGVELVKGATPAENYTAIMAKWGPLAKETAGATDDLTTEQEKFDAKVEDIQTSVGSLITKALGPLLSIVNTKLFPALKSFADKYGPTFAAVFKAIGRVLDAVFGFIQREVMPIIGTLARAIGKALAPVVDAAGDAFEDWKPILKDLWNFIKTTIVPILANVLIPLIGQLLTAFFKVSGLLAGALKRAFEVLAGVFRSFKKTLDDVLDFINDIIRNLRNTPIIGDVIRAVGGGNMVAPVAMTAPTAGTLGAPGGIGQRAVNAATGGGGVVVNINGGDPVAIENTVMRALRGYARKNGNAQVLPSW
jgi:hypothetical protein